MSDYMNDGQEGTAHGLRGSAGDMLRPECARVDADLAELALGTLTAKERVAALAHLAECPRCSSEVEELAAAADQLLHLAPGSEPPLGFEVRVFESWGVNQGAWGRRSWPVWRPKVGLALAACAAVLAFGLGALAGHEATGAGLSPRPSGSAAGTPVHVAALYAGGRSVGQVMVYAGNPTWLFMYVDDSGWQGALSCEVVVDHGPTMVLGHFWLSGGKGAWAARVSQPGWALEPGAARRC